MKKVFRFSLMFALMMAIVVALAPASVATSAPAAAVTLMEIGHPRWHPVDFHMFSAPIGTAATGYAEFVTTSLAILPPPNHVFNPDLIVGPGAPHLPPYTNEVAKGVASLGYQQGTRFTASDFSNGNGVWVVWMNVPKPGTTGSSPDFASGTIIPNSVFTIHVNGITLRNGTLFNAALAQDIKVPPLNALTTPFNVDGASHFPFFIADNIDFGPQGTNPPGNYEYQITMTDAQGNGWSIVANFTITAK